MSGQRRVLLGVLFGLTIAFHWLPPLRESLWLDETVSYWIAAAPFREMLARAQTYQYSSVYFPLLWLVYRIDMGHSELLLRLPSVLAVLAAAAFLHRTARELFDREAGWLTAIAFASLQVVAFAASNARPYGFGLLMVTAAMFFHLRWLRGAGGLREGLLGVGLACAGVYFQPLLGLLLAVQAIGACAWLLAGRLSWRDAIAAGAVAAALLVPDREAIASLFERREMLSWLPPPSPAALAAVFLPPLLLFGFSRWASAARAKAAAREAPEARSLCWLVLLWCVLPPLVLLAVSLVTPTQLFSPRYYGAAAPALAILAGSAIHRLRDFRTRLLVVAALAAGSIIWTDARDSSFVDWREQAAVVRSLALPETTPVLIHSQLIEAAQIDWLEDPERRQYLLAPLAPYPIEGRVIALPYDLRAPALVAYLDRVYRRQLASAERFVVSGRYPEGFRTWFARRAPEFEARDVGGVLVFERGRPQTP